MKDCMFLVDSHCHLDALNYVLLHQDVNDVLKKAADQDVRFILSVSTTLENYRSVRNLVGKYSNVAFSCGVHPLYQDQKFGIEELYHLAMDNDVIALGETGLDYSAILKEIVSKNKIQQQESFRNHIFIARKLKKPVIVHMRNSYSDAIKILKEEKITDCGGVLHCFTGDKIIAKKLLDLGMYISFSGILTFKNAELLRKTALYIPIDRILIETDSPYLTPVPYRGKENQPAMVKNVANCLATIKKLTLQEIATITTGNFSKLFNVDFDKKFVNKSKEKSLLVEV